MTLKIVPNWRAHLRRYTVMALGAIGTLQLSWLAIPQDIKDTLPGWFSQGLALLIVGGGLLGAFVNQNISNGGGNDKQS
jgi:hypothetical protein